MTEKTCRDCGKTKPIEEFHYTSREKGWRTSYCHPCRRRRNRESWHRRSPKARLHQQVKRYGITGKDYERMLGEQGGGCAICGGQNDKDRNLAVDHCHKTGKVRGLLCDRCNHGLGHFQDDPDLLHKAIEYLIPHLADSAV